MIVTEEFLELNKTKNGGWTFAQLVSLGIEWPPRAGWKDLVIGSDISDEQVERFRHYGTYRQSKSERRSIKTAAQAQGQIAKTKAKPKQRDTFPAADAFLASYEWRRTRMAVLKRDGARCACCGATPDHGVKMHVDHIKPRKLFPQMALSLDNLQVLCEECNHGKGNWDMTDWRKGAAHV